jgi:hypothetical protein
LAGGGAGLWCWRRIRQGTASRPRRLRRRSTVIYINLHTRARTHTHTHTHIHTHAHTRTSTVSRDIHISRTWPIIGWLVPALLSYLESGWQVLILPWVVGVRGMVDVNSVLEILAFLRFSTKQRAKIVEDVAIESVKALYSLHQIRYQALNLSISQSRIRSSNAASHSTTAQAQHGAFDTDDPTTQCNSKRRRCVDDDYGETRQRWKRMASDTRGSS